MVTASTKTSGAMYVKRSPISKTGTNCESATSRKYRLKK